MVIDLRRLGLPVVLGVTPGQGGSARVGYDADSRSGGSRVARGVGLAAERLAQQVRPTGSRSRAGCHTVAAGAGSE